jgi:hypothetical protein
VEPGEVRSSEHPDKPLSGINSVKCTSLAYGDRLLRFVNKKTALVSEALKAIDSPVDLQ